MMVSDKAAATLCALQPTRSQKFDRRRGETTQDQVPLWTQERTHTYTASTLQMNAIRSMYHDIDGILRPVYSVLLTN